MNTKKINKINTLSAIFLVLITSLMNLKASSIDKAFLIAEEADHYIGRPYVYGGNSFKKGIDCSAFVKGLYSRYGIFLPRRAEWQVMDTSGCPTYHDIGNTQIGDILYFRNKKGRIHHTAIISGYTGNGEPVITHAKGKEYGVVKEEISNKYKKELTAIKRFEECQSVLNGTYTEKEIAKTIQYIGGKHNLSTMKLFNLINKVSGINPLLIYLEKNEILKKQLSRNKSNGLKVMKKKGMSGMIIEINNLPQAQYIAKKLKEKKISFKAGLSMVDSRNFKNENITDIFYPMVNIQKNIKEIKRCLLKYENSTSQNFCIMEN